MPPPVATIAWRLVHLANGNWIRWEHAFGPGKLMFPDLSVPGTAADAVAYWRGSREPITRWRTTCSDPDLDQQRPTPSGGTLAAGTTVRILVEEQIHHGAEVALLRDLSRTCG